MLKISILLSSAMLLFGMASLEMRLESLESKLDKALQSEMAISQVAAALPARALRP